MPRPQSETSRTASAKVQALRVGRWTHAQPCVGLIWSVLGMKKVSGPLAAIQM